MSFLTSFIGAGANAAKDGTVKFVAGQFPELSSKAQIDMYRQHVVELSQIVAKLQTRLNQDQAEVDAQTSQMNQMKAAAKIVRDQATSAGLVGDAARAPANATETALLNDLNSALDQFTKLKGKVADATTRRDQTLADYNAAKSDCDAAADYATKAEQHLEDMKREQERANQDVTRAQERQHDAEVRAGITKGVDSLHVVEDAMAANVAKAKEKAAAANQAAESYSHSVDANKGGSALQAALAQASGAQPAPNLNSKLSALDD